MSVHLYFGRPATLIRVMTLVLLMAWVLPAVSASKCKGLSTSQCQRNEACTWVSGYTSKQGKKVQAYCRQKASKSSRSGEKKEHKASKSSEKSGKKDKADKMSRKDKKPRSDKEKTEKKSDKKNTQKSSKDTKK